VVVEVTLPDGTKLETRPERAIYATPRAVFVVAANGFEGRKISFRVFHKLPGGQAEDIGYADARLGELVSKRTLLLQDRAIGALELTIDPAEGSRPGTYTGLTVTSAPAPAPAARPDASQPKADASQSRPAAPPPQKNAPPPARPRR